MEQDDLRLFFGGILTVLGGLLICTYWLSLVGIILYVPGFLLIRKSQASDLAKTVAAFFAPLLFSIIALFIYNQGRTSGPSLFIFPKDFNGYARIILDQDCGEPDEFENGRRVYRIPANGILISQHSSFYSITVNGGSLTFAYEDSLGLRTPIEYYDYFSDTSRFEKVKRDTLGRV